MGRVKWIWYLTPMWAAKVQASLRIRAVLPEPPLLAYISSESRGTFRQKARSLAPLNGSEASSWPTSDPGVAGSNPAAGEILLEPKRRFIAQSLSCSPFHRLEMTEILLKGRKTLTHHLNGWACAVKICHDGMLEDTNSLDAPHMV